MPILNPLLLFHIQLPILHNLLQNIKLNIITLHPTASILHSLAIVTICHDEIIVEISIISNLFMEELLEMLDFLSFYSYHFELVLDEVIGGVVE